MNCSFTIAFVFAISLSVSVFAEASEQSTPLVRVTELGAAAEGFPAISADGTTVAVQAHFETSSDAYYLAIQFLNIQSGHIQETVVVEERDDRGRALPAVADGWGHTVWRRTKNLSTRLKNDGYRSMSQGIVSGRSPSTEELPGASIRVSRTGNGRYAIVSRRDQRVLNEIQFNRKTAFCGMTDDRAYLAFPQVIEVWIDPDARAIVLAHGFEYASCMCPNEIFYRPVIMNTSLHISEGAGSPAAEQ